MFTVLGTPSAIRPPLPKGVVFRVWWLPLWVPPLRVQTDGSVRVRMAVSGSWVPPNAGAQDLFYSDHFHDQASRGRDVSELQFRDVNQGTAGIQARGPGSILWSSQWGLRRAPPLDCFPHTPPKSKCPLIRQKGPGTQCGVWGPGQPGSYV